jgi:two-component system, cell cycle response regulator CpdR
VNPSSDPVNGSAAVPVPLRILYVEDNPVVREVTCELLVQTQRHIVALGTAEEALQEFVEQAFDVVITDISLPAMSGLDLARKILDIRPEAPIIIASGYFLDLSLKTWGPNVRSIVKPFDGAEIDALIEELCAGHG